MHSRWARITSSIISRGSRWKEAWSSRLEWPVAVREEWNAFSTMPASAASTPAGSTTQLTRPMASAASGVTWSLSRVSSLARPRPMRRASRRIDPSGMSPWRVAPRPRTASVVATRRSQAAASWSPPADGVAVEHRDHDLVHVLEAVQGADPVPVEGLVDTARRQHGAIHARAERPARAPHDHHPHVRVAGRRLRRVGQLRGQRQVQRVEHVRPVQGDGGDALSRLVEHIRLSHRQLRAPRMSRAITMRCTSEVPSPISVSLASRKIRSMGNSVM